MNLVENTVWQGDLVEGIPVRLEPELINPPENVNLRFVVMEHADDSDTSYIAELLEGTDVFFPEMNGWDPITAKYLQKVSKGDYKTRQRMLEGLSSGYMNFARDMVKALYDSKVDVRMADLPSTSHIPMKLSRIGYNEGLTTAAFSLMAQRDSHIAQNISSEIALAINENSRLRDRVVQATAIFGVGHLSVESALSAAAQRQGIESFTTKLLFTQEAAASTGQDVIDYNNWLRTND